jgi:ATP-dependent Clp protease protease subunit
MSCASTSSAAATAARALTSRAASSKQIGAAALPARRRPVRAAATVRAGALGDPPVPVAVRTAQGQVMDCFSALMMNRIIFIGERIDEDTATRVCAELLALQYDDPKKDIRIFLNCTSGNAVLRHHHPRHDGVRQLRRVRHRHGLRRGPARDDPRGRRQG